MEENKTKKDFFTFDEENVEKVSKKKKTKKPFFKRPAGIILIVVLVFMATVGATFSGFKTVNLIVKGDTWQLWAILTGVLIFVAALGFLLPFMF